MVERGFLARVACLFLLMLVGASLVGLLGAQRAEAQTAAGIYPTLDCVSFDPTVEEVTAHFGYVSYNAETVSVAVGVDNFFSPPPTDRGQPVEFRPGSHPRAFTATFRLDEVSTISWNLLGNRVSASNDESLYCDQVADLRVSQSAAPATPVAGEELTYTLTVTNDGPLAASGVTMRDWLPDGAEFVRASDGCLLDTGTVTCTVGTLAWRASRSVNVVVRPEAGGTLVNTASVSAGQADPDVSNNVASLRTVVEPPPDGEAPETAFSAGPTGATDDPTPTFEFFAYEADANFECRVDSVAEADFQTCASPFTTAELPDGDHVIEVRAVDGAGNRDASPARRSFTVDAVPDPPLPAPAVLSFSPASGVRDKTVTVAVKGTGFEDGAVVHLRRGSLNLRARATTVESGSSLAARFVLPKSTPAGRYTMIVTNPDGQKAVAERRFTVREAR